MVSDSQRSLPWGSDIWADTWKDAWGWLILYHMLIKVRKLQESKVSFIPSLKINIFKVKLDAIWFWLKIDNSYWNQNKHSPCIIVEGIFRFFPIYASVHSHPKENMWKSPISSLKWNMKFPVSGILVALVSERGWKFVGVPINTRSTFTLL